MNQISNQFLSIEQVTDQYLNKSQTVKSNAMPNIPFEEILRQKQAQNVKFYENRHILFTFS